MPKPIPSKYQQAVASALTAGASAFIPDKELRLADLDRRSPLPGIQLTQDPLSVLWIVDNMVWRAKGMTLGYVQRVTYDPAVQTVTVGHFAVEKELERCGLGKALVEAYARLLSRRLCPQKMIFAEEKFRNPGYGALLAKLNAAVISPPGTPTVWEWTVPQTSTGWTSQEQAAFDREFLADWRDAHQDSPEHTGTKQGDSFWSKLTAGLSLKRG